MHILEYLCRIFFLKTLDIYKDYFKDRHKVVAIVVTCIVLSELEIALVHLSLCRSYYVWGAFSGRIGLPPAVTG